MKKALVLLIIICFLPIMAGCSKQADFFGIGTYINLSSNKNSIKFFKESEELISKYEKIFSTQVLGSDIYKVNEAKANVEVKIDSETLKLIVLAKQLYIDTDKAFNIAIYPLVELWQFSPDKFNSKIKNPPNEIDIQEVLKYCDFDDIYINENKISKRYTDSKLDLGGLAKGYIADKILDLAKKYNITQSIINIGGNIQLLGKAQTVGITHPRPKQSQVIAKLKLANLSIVTSGDYERYYQDSLGNRYHHILDYSIGAPSNSELIAVSVIGEKSVLCDALATSVMILGKEKGEKLLAKYGASAIMITNNGIYVYNMKIEILDNEFKFL